MHQSITLTNITDELGNRVEDIENLAVTVMQLYTEEPNEPSWAVEVLPTIALLPAGDANALTLSYAYVIPTETEPGLNRTKLSLEFTFTGGSRVLRIAHEEPNSLWYAAIPGDLNLDKRVDLTDYARLANQFLISGCQTPTWCDRADIDQSSQTALPDLQILSHNWAANKE